MPGTGRFLLYGFSLLLAPLGFHQMAGHPVARGDLEELRGHLPALVVGMGAAGMEDTALELISEYRHLAW